MNQDETLKLWNDCENARKGKSAGGATNAIAHAAATKVWNTWSKSMLDERKALEDAGKWKLKAIRSSDDEVPRDHFEPANEATQAWADKAEAVFGPDASRLNSTEGVNFAGWTFPWNASFTGATFMGSAWFEGAKFMGTAWFLKVNFTGDAEFEDTEFWGAAWFRGAKFTGDDAWFKNAKFFGDARFRGAEFNGNTKFNEACFEAEAEFQGATFTKPARFEYVEFSKLANFNAIRCSHAFSVANARFVTPPDFIQANFDQPPPLDDFRLVGAWGRSFKKLYRGSDADQHTEASRWRWMRRLASQAGDREREIDFYAGEMRASRWLADWPLPFKFYCPSAWAGMLRFWFCAIYALISDYGRSLLRPLILWSLLIIISTGAYLDQHPDVQSNHKYHGTAPSWFDELDDSVSTVWEAYGRKQECYKGNVEAMLPTGEITDAGNPIDKRAVIFTGLTERVRLQINAPAEALQLALRNATIILDGGQEVSHRIYGCLYGVERYGDNPMAYVPPAVSKIIAVQKALSGLFIFLFGLAIRNMLKIK